MGLNRPPASDPLPGGPISPLPPTDDVETDLGGPPTIGGLGILLGGPIGPRDEAVGGNLSSPSYGCRWWSEMFLSESSQTAPENLSVC